MAGLDGERGKEARRGITEGRSSDRDGGMGRGREEDEFLR